MDAGETNTSIRPGWFYHPAEDARVRSADELVDLYFTSVGRNSKPLLNVPPTRDGILHATDVARLGAMRERLDARFAEDLAAGARLEWRRTGARTAEAHVDLGRTVAVGIARVAEEITGGQVVARYVLRGSDGGAWRRLAQGTTIGYAKLNRFTPTAVRRVRLMVEDAAAAPEPVRIRLYAGGTP